MEKLSDDEVRAEEKRIADIQVEIKGLMADGRGRERVSKWEALLSGILQLQEVGRYRPESGPI